MTSGRAFKMVAARITEVEHRLTHAAWCAYVQRAPTVPVKGISSRYVTNVACNTLATRRLVQRSGGGCGGGGGVIQPTGRI